MPYDSNKPEVGKAEEINAMARAAAAMPSDPNEIRNPTPAGNPTGLAAAPTPPLDAGMTPPL